MSAALRDTAGMAEESEPADLVELTRQVFEAIDRRDFEVALEHFAPDAVWQSEVLETSFEGVAAIREFLERWSAVYEAFEVRTEDILDVGYGVVLCVFMNRSRPVEGLGEPRLRFALVIAWNQGVVERVVGHEDIDAARSTAARLAAEREGTVEPDVEPTRRDDGGPGFAG